MRVGALSVAQSEEYAFNAWGPWSIYSAPPNNSPIHTRKILKWIRACPVKAEPTFVEYINMAMT